jgi:hypothetical protein
MIQVYGLGVTAASCISAKKSLGLKFETQSERSPGSLLQGASTADERKGQGHFWLCPHFFSDAHDQRLFSVDSSFFIGISKTI